MIDKSNTGMSGRPELDKGLRTSKTARAPTTDYFWALASVDTKKTEKKEFRCEEANEDGKCMGIGNECEWRSSQRSRSHKLSKTNVPVPKLSHSLTRSTS